MANKKWIVAFLFVFLGCAWFNQFPWWIHPMTDITQLKCHRIHLIHVLQGCEKKNKDLWRVSTTIQTNRFKWNYIEYANSVKLCGVISWVFFLLALRNRFHKSESIEQCSRRRLRASKYCTIHKGSIINSDILSFFNSLAGTTFASFTFAEALNNMSQYIRLKLKHLNT